MHLAYGMALHCREAQRLIAPEKSWREDMYKRIVVAVGDYPELDTAVAYAIALAAESDAELWFLRVCTVPLMFGPPDMLACSHMVMENVMEAHAYVLDCAAAAADEA